MKWLAVFAFILITATRSTYAQVDDRIPPPKEEREVQEFVTRFCRDYENELRIAPLIRRYFVHDFATRVEYCGTTGNCGGFARDFWQKNEDLVDLKVSRSDYSDWYSTAIDGLYLNYRSLHYLAIGRGTSLSDGTNYEELGKVIQSELEKRLGKNSQILKAGVWTSDDQPERPKNLTEYHRNRANREVFNSELRGLLKSYRRLASQNSPANSVKITDFRVYKEKNKDNFFKYGNDVFVYQAWPNTETDIPLKIDLIREHGRLKIVAAYPPID